MQPSKGKLVASDEAPDQLLIQCELGKALRLSYKAVTLEPLPEVMGLLLMQLALAEMPRCTEQGSRETSSVPSERGDDRRSIGSAERSEKGPGIDLPGQVEETC